MGVESGVDPQSQRDPHAMPVLPLSGYDKYKWFHLSRLSFLIWTTGEIAVTFQKGGEVQENVSMQL
jgi:hypothetical protein